MKFLSLLLLFTFLSTSITLAQGENNNWYINATRLLNFNEIPMRVDSINARVINQVYNMTVSSQQGELLFFSEGLTIFDKNAERMPNGQLPTPTSPFRDRAIKPILGFQHFDNPNLYYIFYVKDGGIIRNDGDPAFFRSFTAGELYYSIIDMTLNEGRGDIRPEQKDILLYKGITGGMVALQGYCGSIWVVAHEYNSNRFLAFEATAQGVAAPVISEAGTVINYDNLQDGRNYVQANRKRNF